MVGVDDGDRTAVIWLGVDGGGTKTAFVLVDDVGSVLAHVDRGSADPFVGGLARVRDVLHDGVVAVCNDAGVTPRDVAYAFFGLPAYGELADDHGLDALPAKVLGHERYRCDNDMVCAWAGSLGGEDGVNVIAGTGSMAYGRLADHGVRVGGWGDLVGDEGSARWIGARALQTVSRMADGRAPRGPLLDLVLEHCRVTRPIDLVEVVTVRWRGERGRIAALAAVVDRAAAADPEAEGILRAAADELVLLVYTAARRLAWPAPAMPVSRSGGVFGSATVRSRFDAAIDADERYALREPAMSPVLGAALLAARLGAHGRPAPDLLVSAPER